MSVLITGTTIVYHQIHLIQMMEIKGGVSHIHLWNGKIRGFNLDQIAQLISSHGSDNISSKRKIPILKDA